MYKSQHKGYLQEHVCVFCKEKQIDCKTVSG